MNIWAQMLLVFWEPFYFPTPVIWGAFDDLHRATLAEDYARGIV